MCNLICIHFHCHIGKIVQFEKVNTTDNSNRLTLEQIKGSDESELSTVSGTAMFVVSL